MTLFELSIEDLQVIYTKTLICPEQQTIVDNTIRVFNEFSLDFDFLSHLIHFHKDNGKTDFEICNMIALVALYYTHCDTNEEGYKQLTPYIYRAIVIGAVDWARGVYGKVRSQQFCEIIEEQSRTERVPVPDTEGPLFVDIDFEEASCVWNQNKKRSRISGLYYYPEVETRWKKRKRVHRKN
jgi:hypothetical protein